MKKNNSRWFSLLVGLSLVVFSGLYVAGAGSTQKPLAEERVSSYSPPIIDAIPIDTSSQTVYVYTSGTLNARRVSQVNSRLSGYIESTTEQLIIGNHVKKGELLFSLNDMDTRLALSNAQLNVAEAKVRLAEETVRYKQAGRDITTISNANIASDFAKRIPQLQAAKADHHTKTIALEKAQKDLKNTQIRAPFDGIILGISTNNAEFIDIDTPLVTLAESTTLEIKLPITVEQWNLIDKKNIVNQSIELTSKVLKEKKWVASVNNIIPEIDNQTGRLTIVAEVDNTAKKIPLGVYVNAKIKGNTLNNVLWLPQSALINHSQVWGVSDQKTLNRVSVSVLQYHENRVLIRYQKPSFNVVYFAKSANLNFINNQTVSINKIDF